MANSEMPRNDSEKAARAAVPPDREGRAAEHVGPREKEDRSVRRFPSSRVIGATERGQMLKEVRKIEFPIGLRGYERAAVDRYVERVNRLLAELEMSSSPESAVRHALEEVSEETRAILQRAHETADEITARSRAKADDRLQQAERETQEVRQAAQRDAKETREAAQQEAAELRDATMHEMAELKARALKEIQQLRASAQREADETRGSARREADEMLESAETQTRELARSAEAIGRERRRLIDDMRGIGEQLVAIGEVEGKRFARLGEGVRLGADFAREQTSTEISEPASEPQESARI